jgi:hypothetical protein
MSRRKQWGEWEWGLLLLAVGGALWLVGSLGEKKPARPAAQAQVRQVAPPPPVWVPPPVERPPERSTPEPYRGLSDAEKQAAQRAGAWHMDHRARSGHSLKGSPGYR